jgi:histidyl-tRNA synthetase
MQLNLSKFMTKENAIKLLEVLKTNPKHPEVLELEKHLDAVGVMQYCEYAPSLARGLNVYTGSVWEFYDKQGRVSSSIGGGGRYDKIIGDWIGNGLEYPAVGTTFGLEPVMVLLESLPIYIGRVVDVLVVPFANAPKQINKFIEGLRNEGAKVLMWHGDKVSKAMEYADKEGIPFTIVLGEKELTSGQVTIKNMKTGQGTTIQIADAKKISDFVVSK